MSVDNLTQITSASAEHQRRDVSQDFFGIIQANFPIFADIGLVEVGVATANTHEWFDDVITETTGTLAANIAAHAASATGITITLATGDGAKFQVGDLVRVDEIRPQYEITNIVTDTLTVKEVRGIALGSAAGNGNIIRFTRGQTEKTSFGTPDGARLGTRETNTTQILRKDWEVSWHADKRSIAQPPGLHPVARETSLVENAENRAMEKVMWELYHAATTGVGKVRSSTTDQGRMNGIRQYIDFDTANGGNCIDASGAVSVALMNDVMEQIFNDTRDLSNIRIYMPTVQNRKLALLETNRLRLNDENAQNGRALGNNVTMFFSDIGNSAGTPIIVDPNMPKDEIWFLDTSRIRLVPFFDSTMRSFSRDVGDSATQGFLYGEFTMEVRNGKEAHGCLNNLTV